MELGYWSWVLNDLPVITINGQRVFNSIAFDRPINRPTDRTELYTNRNNLPFKRLLFSAWLIENAFIHILLNEKNAHISCVVLLCWHHSTWEIYPALIVWSIHVGADWRWKLFPSWECARLLLYFLFLIFFL